MKIMKPNKDQVEAEIKALEAIKPKVRHFTEFGGDNRAAMGAMINVLKNDLDYDEMWDTYAEDDYLLEHAEWAREWLDGDSDNLPSEDWKSLELD